MAFKKSVRKATPQQKPTVKPQQNVKPRQEVAKPPQQQVAKVSNSKGVAALDNFDKQMYQDAGLGVSLRANDNITPSISVLQPLSPQVLERDHDASPGDFWMSGANPPVIPGSEGIWFQPAAMTEAWFEFIPRDSGGGFVARYDVEYDNMGRIMPPEGAEQSEDNPNSYSFTESGNNCIHYRHIAGIVWQDGVGLEYVLPFHGTGHTVARSWNTKWTRKRFPDGTLMPAYSHLYNLTTDQRSNKKGTWYQISVDEGTHLRDCSEIVGDPAKALQMARSLAQAFKSGDKLPSVPEDFDTEATTGETQSGGGSTEEIPY